jgi:peptidoglycan/xylan/chitin deacetylase (PgdA/CDA1 family)
MRSSPAASARSSGAPDRPRRTGGPVRYGHVTRPFRVALTFDTEHPDRPAVDPGNARLIMATLARAGVRATFFLQGRWVEAYPGDAAAIASAGHLIGHHSFYHVRMPLLTDAGIATDLADAETAILEAAGADPRPWFRCPFGAGHDDPRVLAAIAMAGYRHVHWTVGFEDWDPAHDAASVERAIVDRTLATGDGAIVLLHSWPDQTAAAVGPIVAQLRAAGATFVTIDELESAPGT